jgi:hypothetical protein
MKNGLFETSNFAILAEHTTGFTYARYLGTYTWKQSLQNETKYVFLSPSLLCKSASEVEERCIWRWRTVSMIQVKLQSLLSIPHALHTHDILGTYTWKQSLQNETKYVFLSPSLLCKSASEVEERCLWRWRTVSMKQVTLQSLLSIPQALHMHDILRANTWKQTLRNETKYVFLSPSLLCKSASEVEERCLWRWRTVSLKQVTLQSFLSIPQALHTHDI